jgi:hypothetical protein
MVEAARRAKIAVPSRGSPLVPDKGSVHRPGCSTTLAFDTQLEHPPIKRFTVLEFKV